MSEVINLRQKRKARDRVRQEKKAVENRLVHGQTKTEKLRIKRETERKTKLLDGHKRETGEE